MMQRTDDWYAVRCGKITASRIKELTAKPKTGQKLNAVLLQLLSERLTGQWTQTPISHEMQWGIDNEERAKMTYELTMFCTVADAGFIPHPSIPMSGASPDGLVGDDGLIEIKCPKSTTHLNTLLMGEVPSEYLPQMMWQMACTGRKWCDFVSFDPRLPEHLQIKIIRVMRDDEMIAKLESEVIKANEVLDSKIKELSNVKR